MKVVITGASGFVGNALCKQLLKQGDQPLGFSRESTNQLVRISSYEQLPVDEKAVLVHLAQNRNVSALYDSQAIKICRNMTKMPWRHIVYASSAMVYGDQRSHPRRPEEKIVAYNEYSRMKIDCEQIFAEAGATCLRLSNLYGEGMCEGAVISDILRQIPTGDTMELRNPNAIRDFLWIEDAAECIGSACIAKANAILNVGSGKATQIGKLARLALELANGPTRPITSKSDSSIQSCLKLDITKTKSLLKWSPKTNLHMGLSFLFSKN